MNLTYAGTHLSNGKPANGSACVTGFDQAGFIMGTSASLFNVSPISHPIITTTNPSSQQILDFARNTITQFSSTDGAGLLYVLSRQLQAVRTRADDVANWPSPFNGLKNDTFEDSKGTWLELLDGASNNENVPYAPLFVNARGVDVIVTVEGSSDDSNNFPKYVLRSSAIPRTLTPSTAARAHSQPSCANPPFSGPLTNNSRPSPKPRTPLSKPASTHGPPSSDATPRNLHPNTRS
jgi:hypothetical protein